MFIVIDVVLVFLLLTLKIFHTFLVLLLLTLNTYMLAQTLPEFWFGYGAATNIYTSEIPFKVLEMT